ncbi:MAG: DUF72 domain-containing protein [Calditrichia bacterium]
MAKLRIGTCSWKYDSWRGLIYSSRDPINYLEEYAKELDTVEIDQWFWSLFGTDKVSLPKPAVVDEYRNSVPDDFLFTIKMPNSITLTHFYRKNKSEPLEPNPYFLSVKLLEQFLQRIGPLKNQLGSLMFQFEYLNKQKMVSQFEFQKRFSRFTEEAPQGYPYGMEIRNPNYLNRHFFEFLNEHNLHFVFLQGYYMPSIVDIYDKFGKYIREKAVIRLHGGDRKEIEEKSRGRWNRILEPKDDELRLVVDMVRDLLAREVDVFLNVNNHYEGSAPITIRKFRELMG